MVNYKYDDQLATMKPLYKNEKLCWHEALCGNECPKNWVIDTNFSVDCRMLRIVEFNLKILN